MSEMRVSRRNNGPNHYLWRGDEAGYVAIHDWLNAHFDKGETCQQCGRSNVSRLEWANKNGGLSRDRDDYLVLCPSCHRKFDNHRTATCIHGHEYTVENIYINPKGHRECRTCRTLTQKEYVGRGNVKRNKG